MSEEPFLSIVVPFHNSAATCRQLLAVLASLETGDDVELIFVDDGSTDETPTLLADFAKQARVPVRIIERSRGGPGAARNSGLDQAGGKFVWFVDSDDVIDPRAIAHARRGQWADVDLVAWDWDHPSIPQRLAPGLHTTGDGPAPSDRFDPIVCNWFARPFLERTSLRFPEYCYYEATPIEAFALPLLVRDYLKVGFIAYRANVETPSITRGSGESAAARYDCLHTIALGMEFVDAAALDREARSAFEAAFVRLFLWYVIGLTPLPGPSWVRAMRIMRLYRSESKRLRVLIDPISLYPGGRASRLVVSLLWRLSATLPPQNAYFRRMRDRAWGHPIAWEMPAMPGRWR